MRRRTRVSVDGDPAGADDPFGDRVTADDPLQELQGFAFGATFGDHPEVTYAGVLAGLGVAQVAWDALVTDGVDARGVGEGHKADRLRVPVNCILLEAIRGLGCRGR